MNEKDVLGNYNKDTAELLGWASLINVYSTLIVRAQGVGLEKLNRIYAEIESREKILREKGVLDNPVFVGVDEEKIEELEALIMGSLMDS